MNALNIKSAGRIGLVLLFIAAVVNPAAALTGLTADYTISPIDPHVGEDISFDASSTTNVSPNATYEWDFDGDGTTDANGSNVTHSFDGAGDHNVTLNVTDPDDSSSDSVTKVVTVGEAPEYEVTATLDNLNSTNASAINVSVNGSVVADLTDEDINDVLEDGNVVTFAYVDDTGNETANETYTVGTGGADITLSDAEITVTETEHTSAGGAGSSSGGIALTTIALVGGAVYILFIRGSSGPNNPDYYCKKCGRDSGSGGQASVCNDCYFK